MANVKISELTAASAVASGNEFEINEAGTSKKVTATQIATFANAQTWAGTAVAGQYGGTGVANTGKTITLGGNLVTSGSYAVTFTLTNTTGVTLPTTGTLATVAGSENLTNKTLTTPVLTNPTVTNYVETVYTPSAGSAFTVDLANGTIQKLTTNGNVTITLPSSVAGKSYTIMVAYGGAHTVTFAGGGTLKWQGGSAPTATSVNGKFDMYTFLCDGTNTFGADGGRNF